MIKPIALATCVVIATNLFTFKANDVPMSTEEMADCRNLNDEDVFMGWLMCGVADGDITPTTTDEEIASSYCEDDANFAELMDCFLICMHRAYKSGGLYCGRVTSNIGEEEE